MKNHFQGLIQYFLTGNKYAAVFSAFNNVVSSCFGRILDDNYKTLIDQFDKELEKANILPTPKIHALVHHVPEFIELNQRPLGFFSEQASEQVHHSFSVFEKNFKLNEKNFDNYKQKLYRCICSYNSQHI